jgi:hypothetical protein
MAQPDDKKMALMAFRLPLLIFVALLLFLGIGILIYKTSVG